jgi:hypothetical protein
MKSAPRALMAQCVIGAAALVGVSLGVLEPLRTARHDAIAQLEQSELLAAKAGEYAVRMPELSRDRATVEARLATVAERSALARDAARLNASIEELAGRTGVTIQRTQPRDSVSAASFAPPAPAAGAEVPGAALAMVKPDAVVGFTIEASGNYAGITRFIEGLETSLGYTRVDSVRVTPDSENEDRARATISTLHFAFSLPKGVQGSNTVASAEVSR